MPTRPRPFLPILSALLRLLPPAIRRRPLAVVGIALAALCGSPQAAPAKPFSEGRRIYIEVCAACHANGVAGAPRYGNRQEWEPRLGRSRDALTHSVLRGKGSMPPKGGNPSVTDGQAMEAMEYLLSSVR